MEKQSKSVLDVLNDRLSQELDYKARCDRGEESYYDLDYDCNMQLEYSVTSWEDVLNEIINSEYSSEEIANGLQEFLKSSTEKMEFIPKSFIQKVQVFAKRKFLEEAVTREDVVEYFLKMDKEQLEELFGAEVARMKNFDQKNAHHCYYLLEHTLHTIDSIKKEGLTKQQFKELRIAALFHDIGKPEVAKMNQRTGQQVFYGHAEKSAGIAKRILTQLGYSEKEIQRMEFYIGHHDDFISYKSDDQLSPNMANHEYIRGITPETVAEIMIQNEYDLARQGYNKDQIRYICYALAHEEEPHFIMGRQPVKIDVNMDEVKEKLGYTTRRYTLDYGKTKSYDVVEYVDKYSLEDYQMLMILCRADANAQKESVKIGDKEVASRQGKLENMKNITQQLSKAKEIFDLSKLSNRFLRNIREDSEVIEIDEEKYKEDMEYRWHIDNNEPMTMDRPKLSSWLNLAGKSSEFLRKLSTKIERDKPRHLSKQVQKDEYERYYSEDIKDLKRMAKIQERKERLQPLEEKLRDEEKEDSKITRTEQLLKEMANEMEKE